MQTHTNTHTHRYIYIHTLVRPLSWPVAQTEALKHSLLKISLPLTMSKNCSRIQTTPLGRPLPLPPLLPLGSWVKCKCEFCPGIKINMRIKLKTSEKCSLRPKWPKRRRDKVEERERAECAALRRRNPNVLFIKSWQPCPATPALSLSLCGFSPTSIQLNLALRKSEKKSKKKQMQKKILIKILNCLQKFAQRCESSCKKRGRHGAG